MKLTPWVLSELYAADVLCPKWTVMWVAIRDRNYLCELASGKRRLIAKYLPPGPVNQSTVTFLSNEYRVLKCLAKKAGVPLAPLPCGRLAEKGIWLQQSLPGKPLRGEEILSGPSLQELVLTRLLELRSSVDSGPLTLKELLVDLRGDSVNRIPAMEAARALDGRLSPVISHNDLNPSNVLVANRCVAFVDWTFSNDRGIPCFDWFDLVAHSARRCSLSWERIIESLACPESELAKVCFGAARLVGHSIRDTCLLLQLYVGTRLRNVANREHELTQAV